MPPERYGSTPLAVLGKGDRVGGCGRPENSRALWGVARLPGQDPRDCANNPGAPVSSWGRKMLEKKSPVIPETGRRITPVGVDAPRPCYRCAGVTGV